MVNKKQLAVFLNKNGWSLEKIAQKYGVSRPRIHQIVSEYNEEYPCEDDSCEVCGNPKCEKKVFEVIELLICKECEQRLNKIN